MSREDYGLPLSGADWWMFDEERVVHLNYRPDGTQISRELFAGDISPTWSGSGSRWLTRCRSPSMRKKSSEL